VHYVSICSPNYLHDAHVRLALRVGAKAICEKPLVINPWNLDQLAQIEAETGGEVSAILQLRHHPQLAALRERVAAEAGRRRRVRLTYVTGRGQWYHASWKGSEERSGGLAANIGVHFFDLLLWLFGDAGAVEVHENDRSTMSGVLALARADVEFLLSVDFARLPFAAAPGARTTHRSIAIDGQEVEFSDAFEDLHTRAYQEILAGRGFRIADVRPSIELVHRIREAARRA
jgi:UDP-N-acetyl-2-amino-2-deoxyglucuronate dehydrogenase